jgi:hypothetical protein
MCEYEKTANDKEKEMKKAFKAAGEVTEEVKKLASDMRRAWYMYHVLMSRKENTEHRIKCISEHELGYDMESGDESGDDMESRDDMESGDDMQWGDEME